MSDNGITLLNRYHLGEVLGQGGMGIVYRAHDSILERDVAIKVLSSTGLGTEGRARLLREAQAAAALNHPNIITVHDTGEANIGREVDHAPFVIMELVEGQNLHEKPPQDLDQTLDITRQLCAALDCAHNKNIIHRDLKPENVILTGDGTVKLVDFGLARSMSSRLTTEGTIVGTLSYMAPELALGKDFDGRVDLYSLGVMLYELTTGQLPFTADDPVSVITQHLYAPIVPPRVHNAEIPPHLNALIVKLLAKDPDGRPGSAAEVLAALGSLDRAKEEVAPTEELSLLDRIVRGSLAGRADELGQARTLWNKVRDGEGQTILISGEPGIGKTRIIRELVTQAEVTGGTAIVGECYPEEMAPYTPISQIVRRTFQNGSGNGFDLPEFVLADLLSLAPDLWPKFQNVKPNPELEPKLQQQRLFENMISFTRALAKRAPLLLVIEDAHWADSGSLGILRNLIRRTRRLPVMIVTTYREVELDETLPFNQLLMDLNRERLAAHMKLSRLNCQETKSMLESLFRAEVTSEFLEGIYDPTEGNPFFIEEVCKSLVESGQVYYEDGAWQRPEMSDLAIPQSVRITIQSRFSDLHQESQDILRVAAVIGREFDFNTLEAASEFGEDMLINALESAERTQLIEEISAKLGGTFSFTHALISATLYEGLSGLRRRRMHQQVGEAIEELRPDEVEILAHHFGTSGDEGKAHKYYSLAGERALNTFTNQEAEGYLRLALEYDPAEIEGAELLSNLAEAVVRLGRLEEAIEIWQQAADVNVKNHELDEAAHCYTRMANTMWFTGKTEEALKIACSGLELTEGATESEGLAGLVHETARLNLFSGNPNEAKRLCKQALEMALQIPSSEVEVEVLITQGILPDASEEDAITKMEKAAKIAWEEGLLFQAHRAHNNLGVNLTEHKADFRGAREHYMRSTDISRQMGDIAGEFFTYNNAIFATIVLGEFTQAEKMISQAEELLKDVSDPYSSGRQLQQNLAYLEFAKGNLEDSAKKYREIVAKWSEDESRFDLAGDYLMLVIVLTSLSEFDEAATILLEVVDMVDSYGEGNVIYRAYARAYLAALYGRMGEAERARNVYDEANRILEDRTTIDLKRALDLAHTYILVSEEKWSEAWSAFEARIKVYNEAEQVPHCLELTQQWAEALQKHGEPEDIELAKNLLEEALKISVDIGATGHVARIEARLDELEVNF